MAKETLPYPGKDFRQAGTYAVQLTRFTSATTHTVTVDAGSTLARKLL